jgi:hypothetical protein
MHAGKKERLGSACANPKDLLAFYVWLGWMYLMAMINDALFAIFLKFLDDHRVATSHNLALRRFFLGGVRDDDPRRRISPRPQYDGRQHDRVTDGTA